MTRLKKQITHRSSPKVYAFAHAHAHDARTYTGHTQALDCTLTHTHWEKIKCFNQLATAHNEDPLSPSYQLPSATYLCLQRADFSLFLQPA